jgi:hypothetical protein
MGCIAVWQKLALPLHALMHTTASLSLYELEGVTAVV